MQISTKAADPTQFLKFASVLMLRIPLKKTHGSESLARSAQKSNRLLLMRHPTPINVIKMCCNFLSYQLNLYK